MNVKKNIRYKIYLISYDDNVTENFCRTIIIFGSDCWQLINLCIRRTSKMTYDGSSKLLLTIYRNWIIGAHLRQEII